MPKQYLLFIILFFILGVSNLNVSSNDEEQSVGGYSSDRDNNLASFLLNEDIGFYDYVITKYIENTNFNGNVLIARHGMILYKNSLGYSDFENQTPLNDSTAFQLASITKTFTATAVLLLQHRGFLDVDDPLVQYIPEFPYDNITIRQLLNHTSGLQNYMWLIENHWRKNSKPNNEDMLDMFVKHRLPLNFYPGHRFAYSNTGYAFLALLIERITNESYAEFIQTNIFEPLNMNHSFVKNTQDHETIENKAYGYRRFRNSYIKISNNYIDGIQGDKGIYSSVIDLLKWDQALYSNKILPQNIIQKAFEYAQLNNKRTVNYGLGWRLQKFIDRKVVHHPGRWNGYRTSFKRFIEDNVTIIILNNTNKNIKNLVDELELIVFQDEVEQFKANKKDTTRLKNI